MLTSNEGFVALKATLVPAEPYPKKKTSLTLRMPMLTEQLCSSMGIESFELTLFGKTARRRITRPRAEDSRKRGKPAQGNGLGLCDSGELLSSCCARILMDFMTPSYWCSSNENLCKVERGAVKHLRSFPMATYRSSTLLS